MAMRSLLLSVAVLVPFQSGLLAPIEFRLPAAGAATSLVSLEIETIPLDRVR
ncbi:MAG: hypothetical protein WBM03_13105 [Steroidobacteraceae bacterium]